MTRNNPHARRHRYVRPIPALFPLLVGLGCTTFDSSADGGGTAGTGGAEPPPMAGHRVVCCFTGTWDETNPPPSTAWGCQEAQPECMDPEVWDQDDDDMLEDQELAAFCLQKCYPGWDAGENTSPGWELYGGSPGTWFDSCSPYVGGQLPLMTHIDSMNSCTPGEVVTYGEQLDVPPTHEGSFTSDSRSSTVDVAMLGQPFAVEYELHVRFVLDKCDGAGIDGGTCRVVLSAFDMTTTSPIQVGDYVAVDGTLDLNAPVSAPVSFGECRLGECVGTFEMSKAAGNPLGVNLFWTQRNSQTSSIDEGAIHLGNDGGALGGVDALTGVLTLDTSGSTGTLRLVGGGADSLGGDFASAEFDIIGSVAPL